MKIKFEKIASKICDSHVHYVHFRDINSIEQVTDFFEILGIDKVGISVVNP